MTKGIGVSYLLLVLCATALARPHISKECTRQYTIVNGDTCDGISAQQQVSTHQLASLNKKINPKCTNLAVGDTLCLASATKDCKPVQVVQQGDICANIAHQAGISVSDLLANNPNISKDCTNIYVGEVLCVASASNSTMSNVSTSSALPGSPLSDIGPPGSASSDGTPLDINLPPISGENSPLAGLPLGSNFNLTDTSGSVPLPGSAVPPLGLDPNNPANGFNIPQASGGAPGAGDSSSLPLPSGISGPLPLANITLPDLNISPQATTSSNLNPNALPPLNISSDASGTPFSLSVPEMVDPSNTPSFSGPGEGFGNTGSSDSAAGSPGAGAIPVSPNVKKTTHGHHPSAGLFPN